MALKSKAALQAGLNQDADWAYPMPYKSDAQRRFFHTDTAKRQGISDKTVSEFDQASKGKKLPRKVTKGRAMRGRR